MPEGMKRALGLAALGVGLAALAFWALGGAAALEAQGIAAQRAFRDSLAGALRALRAGEGAALWGLVALGFGYGVLHAAGPGHGKVLIGGYGVGRRVPLGRMVAIATLASLGQATVAVVVVYGGIGLLGMTRDAIGAAGDGWMLATGHVFMVAIGLWLVWRGLRGLGRLARPARGGGSLHHAHHHAHDHSHDHTHDHGQGACEDCGHRHGPTLEEVEAATSWREAAMLIAAIAIRPCTGALMLLVLTWQLGLVWAGIAGAYAIGAGTAVVTVAVAALAVSAREGAFAGIPGLGRLRALMPVVEVTVGLLIAGVAAMLLLRM